MAEEAGASVRALAFYLPQFHPIPENDAWWGRGFTEWHSVARARPLFEGHQQPNLPADLGFYDLRLSEVREAQATLARAHGISGFVYHHYWFAGRRMLERPFEEVLRSGRPDFPFALCWANEHWTRRWDGRSEEVLIAQEFGDAELEQHAAWLARAFEDPRYIRIRARPLFIVYKAQAFPGEPGEYLARLRERCVANGTDDPYLVQVEAHTTDRAPADNGCDAEVEFHPQRLWDLAPTLREGRFGHNHVFDYAAVVEGHRRREPPAWDRYPCVVPAWDNSPRMGGFDLPATLLVGADPLSYEAWLREVAEREAKRGEGIVFINAWNEWAESAYLEPDLRHGRGYLEATRAVFGEGHARATAPSLEEPEWDSVAAYHELHERYLAAQRDREADVRRGQATAAARIDELKQELATYKQVAYDNERWANNERRVRVEAEEWAREEQRVRQMLEGTLAELPATEAAEPERARRRPLRGIARRARAASRRLAGASSPPAAQPPGPSAPRIAGEAEGRQDAVEPPDRWEQLESRIVWVFGAPRSGTTWLTQLLIHPWGLSATDATALAAPKRQWLEPPDAIPVNEPYFGEHIAPRIPAPTGSAAAGRAEAYPLGAVGAWVRRDAEVGAGTINARNAGRPSYVFSGEYADAWRPALRRLILERVAAQERRVAELHGAREPLIVIKEPRGAHAAAMLMSLLPGSRMICLLRDGRDVIDSWLHAHLEGGFLANYERPAVKESQRLEFVEREARDWLARIEGLEAARAAHPEGLTRRLRYEELRSGAAGVMDDVFAWLGLERSPERLEEMALDTAFERLAAAEVGSGKFHRFAEVGHWRRGLTPAEQEVVQEVMGERLADLGYPAGEAVNAADRAA